MANCLKIAFQGLIIGSKCWVLMFPDFMRLISWCKRPLF